VWCRGLNASFNSMHSSPTLTQSNASQSTEAKLKINSKPLKLGHPLALITDGHSLVRTRKKPLVPSGP
jgi:hypothetical protein